MIDPDVEDNFFRAAYADWEQLQERRRISSAAARNCRRRMRRKGRPETLQFRRFCDCAFDQVPLRGPDPRCRSCMGTGRLWCRSRMNPNRTTLGKGR